MITSQTRGRPRLRPSYEEDSLAATKVPVAVPSRAGAVHSKANAGREIPDPHAWGQAERSGGLGQGPQRYNDPGQVAFSRYLPALSSADHRTGVKNACADPNFQVYSRKPGIQFGPFLNERNIGSCSIQPNPHRTHVSATAMAYRQARFDQRFPTLRWNIKGYPGDLAGGLQLAPCPIRIKVTSPKLAWVKEAALRVKALSHKNSGLVDTSDNLYVQEPVTDLHTPQAVAARYGLMTEGIARVVGNAFPGPVPSLVGDDNRGVDIHIRADPTNLSRFSRPGSLPLRTRMGAIVNPEQVDIVSARLQGVEIGTAMSDVKAVSRQDSCRSPGAVGSGGKHAFQQVSFGNLPVVLLAATLLVLSELVAEFCAFYDLLAIVIGAVPLLPDLMLGLWTVASPATSTPALGRP